MTTPPPTRTPGEPPARIDWDAEEEAAEVADRPGASWSTHRRWWILGIVAVLVLSAMAVVWGLSATVGRVHWNQAGHQVVSDEQVEVRLDVQRDPTREVTCRIEAQDAGHAVVGRTEVVIAPAPASPSRHVFAVRTAAPAVTGYVDECWYTDDGAPDRGPGA